MSVKTRFAPSPTGLLQFVPTALFSALFAKSRAGVFLLRIDDSDADVARGRETNALRGSAFLSHDAKLWRDAICADAPPLSAKAPEEIEALPAGSFRRVSDALDADMDFGSFANRVKVASRKPLSGRVLNSAID